MNEITLQWIRFSQMIFAACFAGCYGFGGISGKWKRRFLGGGGYGVAVLIFSWLLGSFSWYYIACIPFTMLALSLGYGKGKKYQDKPQPALDKIFKRAYCGLSYSCASLPIYIVTGKWQLFALHTMMCLMISIWAGVYSIFADARAEETAIAMAIVYIPLLTL